MMDLEIYEEQYEKTPKGGKGKDCAVSKDFERNEKPNKKKTSSKNSRTSIVISKKLHANKQYLNKKEQVENAKIASIVYEEESKMASQFELGL